jgi:hypothetical protein
LQVHKDNVHLVNLSAKEHSDRL